MAYDVSEAYLEAQVMAASPLEPSALAKSYPVMLG